MALHLPGIYLFVKYHGTKAHEIARNTKHQFHTAFRSDLVIMRLPLPKMLNTIWKSNCAIACWPDAYPETHGVLYHNLMNRTQAAVREGQLQDLSITSMTVKELDPDTRSWKSLVSSYKMPHEEESLNHGLKRKWEDGDDPSAERPPPRGPRALVDTATSQQEAWQIIRSPDLPIIPEQEKKPAEVLMYHRPPDTPPPPKLVDDAAKDSELDSLRKRMKVMEEMIRTQMSLKVRLDEAANKFEAEHQARRRLEEAVADREARLIETKKLLEEEKARRKEADDYVLSSRRTAMALRESENRSQMEYDELLRRYERGQDDASDMRHTETSLRRDLDAALKDLDESHQNTKHEKNRRRDYATQLTKASITEMSLKRRLESTTAQLESVVREQKKEHDDMVVAKKRDDEVSLEKSKTHRLMLKEAESATAAARASEQEMKQRLLHMARALETEKRLRREAEDAISDIRRECREPFVVPSLLDAFVELARLTTVATHTEDTQTPKNESYTPTTPVSDVKSERLSVS